MTLTQLEYLISLDKHRNFALAAEKSFITQPTLSIQIQNLEEELGVILFDRKRKPVVPTDAGIQVIHQARTILREAKRMDEVVHSLKGTVAGQYRLGIIPTIAETLVPLLLPKFKEHYPGVELSIEELQTEQIIERLVTDELDGAIAATPLEQGELSETPLYYEGFCLYMHPKHPLAQKNRIYVEELKKEQVWLLGEGHCFRNQVEQLCQLSTDRDPTFESGNFHTLIQLTNQQYGVTVLPRLIADKLPQSQRKNVRELAPPQAFRQVSLVSHRTYVKEKTAKILCDWIRSCIPSEMQKPKKTTVSPLKATT